MDGYNDLIEKILTKLKNTKFVVLATSDKEGNVSACQMCLNNEGLDLYFQTDSSFEKIKNIKENNKVAINMGTFYFKGKATILGRASENEKFVNMIKERHPETYKSYTNIPTEVVIKVDLTEARIWGVDNGKSIDEQETITVVDLVNQKTKIITCAKLEEE